MYLKGENLIEEVYCSHADDNIFTVVIFLLFLNCVDIIINISRDIRLLQFQY